MSTPIDDGVNTNETGDETHSSAGHEPWVVTSASSCLSTPVTSEEVSRQIKTATYQLTNQFKQHFDLMKELQKVPPKRNEETNGLV